jgi:hypothetical protein
VAHLIWWLVCQCCCSRLTCSFTQLWRWDHALGVGVRHCGIHMQTSVITSASDHQHCIAYGMVVAPQTEPGPLPVQSLMTATACAGMLFDGGCPIDVPCRADSGCNVHCFACKPAHLYQPLQRHVKHCTGCWLCISGAACTRAVVPLAAGHQCGWMSAVGLQL